MKKYLYIILLVVVVFGQADNNDSIEMKDGTIHKGTIVDESPFIVIIELDNFLKTRLSLPKRKVKNINKGNKVIDNKILTLEQESINVYNKKYSNAIGFCSDKDIYLSALSIPWGIRFESSAGFDVTVQNSDSGDESKLKTTRLGIGILFEEITDKELRLFSYYGLRVLNTKTTFGSKSSESVSNLSISPLLGSNLYVNDRMSIGGELQLNIVKDSPDASDDVTYFQYNLYSKIFLRVFF